MADLRLSVEFTNITFRFYFISKNWLCNGGGNVRRCRYSVEAVITFKVRLCSYL